LVCQNQNIADSDAGLAKDLRNEVAKLVKSGQSQSEITDYLTVRYGDFVRYSPPVRIDTILLWVLPFLVLVIAASVLIFTIKRNQNNKESNS
jgi:cytochrome c-type biogenesis protein CcmH